MTSRSPAGTRTAGAAATAARTARWPLAALSLSMLMPSLATSIANAGLPVLAEAFGASFQAVQWIVLAYLLAITTLIVSAGRLGDLLGRRRLLMAGTALFTAASLACGMAPALGWLVAARVAQGLGAAMMMALTVAFVGQTVPRERTGSAMGLLGTMSAIGTTLGPSLGGVLIAATGWRAMFLVNVPLGVAALLMSYRHLPADRGAGAAARERFDARGTLLLALALGAYALATTLGRGRFGLLNLGLLAAAAAGLAAFAAAQSRTASPLIRLAILRDRALGAGLAANTLISAVMMATLVVGPFYLTRALGLEAAAAGFVLAAGPLVAALAGVPAGRLVDRLGAPRMTILGLAGTAAGAVALALLPAASGIGGYVGSMVAMTSGYALFHVANNTAVLGDVAPERRGVISGVLSLSRHLGLVTGAAVMGAVFAAAVGSADMAAAAPAAVAAGMRTTFAVAAGLIGLAIGIAWIGGGSWRGWRAPAPAGAATHAA